MRVLAACRLMCGRSLTFRLVVKRSAGYARLSGAAQELTTGSVRLSLTAHRAAKPQSSALTSRDGHQRRLTIGVTENQVEFGFQVAGAG